MDSVTIGLSRLEKTTRNLYRLTLYVSEGESRVSNLYHLITGEHGYVDMPSYKAHPNYVMTEGDQFTIDVTAPQAEYIVEKMSMDIID